MVFTGTYEHVIDAKNRLAIPADVRDLLFRAAGHDVRGEVRGELRGQEKSAVLYVTLGEGQALCLYTEQGFEQRAAELDKSELDADELLAYERVMFSLASRIELDKQGRVLLPENLLKMAGLKTEVVLIGVKDHLEIRDRAAWQEHIAQVLANQPRILMNPRRAMRKPPSNQD